MNKRIWLITGCSTGLGRSLAKYVADQGDQVVATVRKSSQVDEINNLNPEHIDTILMDVRNEGDMQKGLDYIQSKYGRLDVLVNNAGYGSIGPVEEIDMSEVRNQFDVNVHGPIRLIQLALPQMRIQKSGHILNVTSIAGLRGAAGLGIYNASKFALEGLGEALAHEVKHLGIRVINIEPGPFKTKWAGESATYHEVKHEDYKASAGELIDLLHTRDGQQPGDPDKAAAAMYDITKIDNPPVHLPLGQFAYNGAYAKIDDLKSELKSFEHIGVPTDYDS